MVTGLTLLAVVVMMLLPTASAAQNPNMEESGKILWLAGNTSLPVYHDHPHRREEVLKYMPNDLEAQTRAAMDGIKQTLDAAGASFKDVVHMFVFRARPQMGDIGRAARVINSYFAPFAHKPTSTNIEIGRASCRERVYVLV